MDFLIGQCSIAFAQHSSIILTLFMAGLVGGFTHCIGMCGPFVIAQCSKKSETNNVNYGQAPYLQRLTGKLLLPYHLGRMTTYIGLGIIASLLSKQIIGTETQRIISVVFLSLAGLIFIASALPKIRKFNIGRKLFGFTGLISKTAQIFIANPRGLKGYSLGILLGFLPCGLIFAALMVVATTVNPFSAAIAMALFALGTIPALLIVEFGGAIALHKWPKVTQFCARMAMIFNGISLFILAGRMIW